MTIVYSADALGFYAGTLQVSPRFPGQGLPANTCEDGPPAMALPAWHGWQRVGDTWQKAPDNRGRQGFVDGQRHVCVNPELPEGFSDEAPKPVPQTPEEQQAMFTAAIQAHLDGFARTRNYDGILSATTYATSTVPKFRTEGQYAVEARDSTWAKAYEILGAVLSGMRPMPASIDDVLADLPQLVWPEVPGA